MTRRPRPFDPKPGQPGAAITYTVSTPDGPVERTGIVWSDGPMPSSVWVTPDDAPGTAVAVKIPTKLRAERDGARPTALPTHGAYGEQWQADTLYQCNRARTYPQAYRMWHRGQGRAYDVRAGYTHGTRFIAADRNYWHQTWHLDQDCTHAATGAPATPGSPDTGQAATSSGAIVAALLGRHHHFDPVHPGDLCPVCVLTPAPSPSLPPSSRQEVPAMTGPTYHLDYYATRDDATYSYGEALDSRDITADDDSDAAYFRVKADAQDPDLFPEGATTATLWSSEPGGGMPVAIYPVYPDPAPTSTPTAVPATTGAGDGGDPGVTDLAELAAYLNDCAGHAESLTERARRLQEIASSDLALTPRLRDAIGEAENICALAASAVAELPAALRADLDV
ncbi:hypothetical protein [Cryptosporangium phraense]|uniref:Uncharacterized protein n=1 Tax=Cryptosporangium phraense TaxID=2593070 RepID=A0A545AQY1_9ACTN|nr:hypothetical protein [Cryptosporangium phraense]TQS43740.1 hypothetical protein FL583_17030 [Cryptosporangium phraense]